MNVLAYAPGCQFRSVLAFTKSMAALDIKGQLVDEPRVRILYLARNPYVFPICSIVFCNEFGAL